MKPGKPLERRTELSRGSRPLARSKGLSGGYNSTGPPKARKRSSFTPASEAQRAKVRDLGFCIACGREGSEYLAIDPAHLVPRSKGGCDDAACVVPLCRDQNGGCHRAFDDGDLDLLAVVACRWPAQLVEVRHALEHLQPAPLLEQLANDRLQWRGDLREAA